MSKPIEIDRRRYIKIIQGRIKKNLEKYIQDDNLIGRKSSDGKTIKIPVPFIDIPKFRYGFTGTGGVGQGEGEEGDSLGSPHGHEPGPAGNLPGEHISEVDLTIEELAQILGAGLSLPHIKPKGKDVLTGEVKKYLGRRKIGPRSLVTFRWTFLEALKRSIMLGVYDPENPRVVIIPQDLRFKEYVTKIKPQNAAVIFYIMDVSGSMGLEQKTLVKLTIWWLDIWLMSHYRGLQRRFIVHDTRGWEVSETEFYSISEAGGTYISSGIKKAHELAVEYAPEDWNRYIFQFSDGDNWGQEDDDRCTSLLKEYILPTFNQYAYGQVKSGYFSGKYLNLLEKNFSGVHNLVSCKIDGREAIPGAIKTFLGRGL